MVSTTVDPLSLTLPTSWVIPLWIYCFLITVASLLGNSTVLYSSIRYNSIKLDRISVLLVQNLAVADLIYTLMIVFPILVTYSAGGWVLGTGWCWAMSQLTFIPGTVNTLTVLTITLYRLKILLNPFSGVSTSMGRAMVGMIWGMSLLGTIISLSYGSSSIFSPTAARCNSSIYRHPNGGPVFLIAATGLLIILPVFSITLGNMAVGAVALKKSSSGNRSKGVATVTALSTLFIASWTPLVIFTFFRIKKMAVPSLLDLLAFHCIFLNAAGNPILYTLTNRRFGEYVKTTCHGIMTHGLGCMRRVLVVGTANQGDRSNNTASTTL